MVVKVLSGSKRMNVSYTRFTVWHQPVEPPPPAWLVASGSLGFLCCRTVIETETEHLPSCLRAVPSSLLMSTCLIRTAGWAPRQQQFSTACEWDWRAICWPKSLIISTSLSGGGWRMGRQRGEPGGNKGREQKDDTKWLPDVAAQRGEKGSWWFAAQRTGGQIHCGTIHGRA